MGEAIRVLVVDDHDIIRRGVIQILESEPDIQVVDEARNGLDAINKALALRPDVIIMDIFMPDRNGLEVTAAIKEDLPEARVLMWTVSDNEEDLFHALKLGAHGYLLKSATITEMVDAVRRTAADETMLSSRMATKLVSEFRHRDESHPCLSPRELEVLLLVAEGFTDADIGQRLFISERTVRTHLRRLLDKLHLKNRVQAAVYAGRLKLKNSQP